MTEELMADITDFVIRNRRVSVPHHYASDATRAFNEYVHWLSNQTKIDWKAHMSCGRMSVTFDTLGCEVWFDAGPFPRDGVVQYESRL